MRDTLPTAADEIDSSDDDDEPPTLVDLAPPAPPSPTNTGPPPIIASSAALLPPCPVTILSGFLGSGKTTLIQYILKSPDHGKRIAVIENEFGEGLDVESLIARDGIANGDNNTNNSLQDLIELPNGCICCTVKDTLVTTLEMLLEKRSDLDYILIEASGMANPGPIASVFWLDDALESRLQLDGIVTLVDSYHILQQLESTEEAAQQIAYADRLLVNKIDLLTSSDDDDEDNDDNDNDNDNNNGDNKSKKKQGRPSLQTVQETLRKLHPTAPMQLTTYSQIPNLDWILNANCFGGAARLEELDAICSSSSISSDNNIVFSQQQQPAKGASIAASDHDHDHSHSHDHTADGGDCHECHDQEQKQHQHQQQQQQQSHRHTDAVSTVAFQRKGSVDLTKLNRWLAEILWPNQDETDKVLTTILHDPSQKERLLKTEETKTCMQLFRIKGIVSAVLDEEEDEDDDNTTTNNTTTTNNNDAGLDRRRFIVQAVHDLWEVHPASDDLQWQDGEERETKIVVIGKYLQKETLEQGFLSCFK